MKVAWACIVGFIFFWALACGDGTTGTGCSNEGATKRDSGGHVWVCKPDKGRLGQPLTWHKES